MKWILRVIILLMVICVLPVQASQPTSEEPVRLTYNASWQGLSIARARLKFLENPNQIDSTFQVKSNGLVRILGKFKIHSTGISHKGLDGWETTQYTSHELKRGKKRKLNWSLDTSSGFATGGQRNPNTLCRTPVGPLTALFEVRQRVKQFQQDLKHNINPLNNKFSISIFDGRRHFDLHVDIKGQTSIEYGDKRHRLTHLHLTGTPLLGIKKKRFENWEKSSVDLFFTTDAQTIPWLAYVNLSASKATMMLAEN